ncbi:MAG: SAM-dependent methyltransferase, partial [Proteobacteria bacterium]|nr:SAM-dependent methyltransferase [Pseudomonadota bacterium]
EHLKSVAKNVRERNNIQNNVRGWEWKPLPYVLATTNLILHDIELPNITYRDSLDKSLSQYNEKDRVDVIEFIEIYFKGDKADEDKKRIIKNYTKSITTLNY